MPTPVLKGIKGTVGISGTLTFRRKFTLAKHKKKKNIKKKGTKYG